MFITKAAKRSLRKTNKIRIGNYNFSHGKRFARNISTKIYLFWKTRSCIASRVTVIVTTDLLSRVTVATFDAFQIIWPIFHRRKKIEVFTQKWRQFRREGWIRTLEQVILAEGRLEERSLDSEAASRNDVTLRHTSVYRQRVGFSRDDFITT